IFRCLQPVNCLQSNSCMPCIAFVPLCGLRFFDIFLKWILVHSISPRYFFFSQENHHFLLLITCKIWINYRRVLCLPGTEYTRSPENCSNTKLSRLFPFAP